ncbi:hypothetical protein Lal_00031816 [Lupinus albus]|nr:hypothetical protein Lal_00031816 [Lupinus albus]
MFQAMQYSKDKGQFFRMDLLEEVFLEVEKQPRVFDHLEMNLIDMGSKRKNTKWRNFYRNLILKGDSSKKNWRLLNNGLMQRRKIRS